MSAAEKREYLGDSVYIKNDGTALIISLNNGEKDHSIIVLEDFVVINLLKYLEDWVNERSDR